MLTNIYTHTNFHLHTHTRRHTHLFTIISPQHSTQRGQVDTNPTLVNKFVSRHTRPYARTNTQIHTHTNLQMNVHLYSHMCVHAHLVFLLHTARTGGRETLTPSWSSR